MAAPALRASFCGAFAAPTAKRNVQQRRSVVQVRVVVSRKCVVCARGAMCVAGVPGEPLRADRLVYEGLRARPSSLLA